MRQLWILPFLVVLLAAAPPDAPTVDYYKEGQRLFGEKDFQAALEAFERVDALVPNEPKVYSWIGACLNELGRYAEAKARLEAAFGLLRTEQRRALDENQPVTPIDIGYFTLLARIQVNLGEFEQAIETINAYSSEDDPNVDAAKKKQAIEAARQALKIKLVAVGTECLRSRDLDCARAMFTKAELLQPATPSVRESIAREALIRADKAPAATEEDKAKKAELHETAVQASRIWLEEAGADSTDAQRTLAKALSGTKTREGYEEAIPLLTSLWAGSADQAARDGSMQLDLAVAHAGLEQWEPAVAAASTYIELNPSDPLGQGYCMRSFSQFQLGRCAEAISDGQHCKNADGSRRSLKHVEACQQRQAQQEAGKAAAKGARLESKCDHLYARVKWARGLPGEVSLHDLVKIMTDLKAGEAACGSYLEAAERRESGNGVSSMTPALCAAGAKTASFPLNLSSQSKEELESLRAKTKEFLALCRPHLDASQVRGVEGGLLKVEQALE